MARCVICDFCDDVEEDNTSYLVPINDGDSYNFAHKTEVEYQLDLDGKEIPVCNICSAWVPKKEEQYD